MENYLPGTMIEVKPQDCERVLSSIFSTGGLVLSQVCKLTGLSQHTIQNWVKRGFLSSPKNKKYTQRQFCRIVIINMLKESIQLENIVKLLSYINGDLRDESDDMIDDVKLYNYFNEIIVLGEEKILDAENFIEEVTNDGEDASDEKKKRLRKVLEIMMTAHTAAYMKRQVDISIRALENTNINRNTNIKRKGENGL